MKELNSDWNLKIYKGDLYDYIDAIIHNLRSIYKIGKSLLKSIKLNDNIINDIEDIPKIVKKLTKI